jgi:hypothetical protein
MSSSMPPNDADEVDPLPQSLDRPLPDGMVQAATA